MSEDGKAHSFNHYPDTLHPRNHLFLDNMEIEFDIESGLLQTGIAYPSSWNASNESQYSPQNTDFSSIEFWGKVSDYVALNLNEYYLEKIIVFD